MRFWAYFPLLRLRTPVLSGSFAKAFRTSSRVRYTKGLPMLADSLATATHDNNQQVTKRQRVLRMAPLPGAIGFWDMGAIKAYLEFKEK